MCRHPKPYCQNSCPFAPNTGTEVRKPLSPRSLPFLDVRRLVLLSYLHATASPPLAALHTLSLS